jgi:hypothetical protein
MSATMVVPGRGPADAMHGFPSITRGARLVVGESINTEINRIQRIWLRADEAFEAAGYDVGVNDAGIENIEVSNVFGGPHKSLVASPIDRFPNVSVTAYATRPSGQDAQSDRIDVPELSLIVELMVRAGPRTVDNALLIESIVHRRVERTTEALLATISKSRNLYGTVDSISEPRGGIVNASWTRNEDSEGEAGATYVLHGARFVYALIRRVSRNYY